MKENKFMMGEEEENANSKASNVTTTNSHKKQPVRHHVKRRSSGRVHVAKLAPMARANAAHTDTETEFMDDNNENNTRPVIKRSQSQRSLHRMSIDRKGFTTLTKRKSTQIDKPLNITQLKDKEEEEEEKEPIKTKSSSTYSTSNPASLSTRVIAEPVEQTFNAVANTLVIPKTNIIPTSIISQSPDRITTTTKTTTKAKKQLLRSQFLASSYEEPSYITNKPDFQMTSTSNNTGRKLQTRTNSNNMSRTQQKLMLQKQQSQVEDETSPIHPRNMQKINKELEILSKENRCIKRYQDPMRASLSRCLEKQQQPAVNRHLLGANKHAISTLTLPTINGLEQQQQQQQHKIPHLEQRQIAHRHHHLKTIALTRNQNQTTEISSSQGSMNNSSNSIWNATSALLDRLFNS